ncbi:MAG: PLP-dependent aminotransferase family protein [Vallitaleaceae bacterium]|jgi:2-aminoadipate transaminase|nr:PLP-dependent aminotransferase family protein [Vallitaleaceae bacterium]
MKFAKRTELIKSSDTRELLSIIGFDEMISFAGGLPAKEGFPVEELKGIAADVFDRYGYRALQYGPTEGIKELRKMIAEINTKKHGTLINENQVLITSGGQQALDILGKIFIDEGDSILMEEPTYFSAINAFKAYYPHIVGVETDLEGAVVGNLKASIVDYPEAKLAYYIPDYQNPTGKSWELTRKEAVLRVHQKSGVPIIEDCPYSDLQFEGEKVPSFLALGNMKSVIHLGSFSKVFCPGFRLGYIIAEEAVIKKCVLMKQSMDLHTSNFSQVMLLEYIKTHGLEANIKKIITIYKKKRDIMIQAIKDYLPGSVTYHKPKGGMFLWLDLGKGHDSRKFYKKALEEKVAFVAGDAFYLHERVSSGLRLNYTNTSDEDIIVGIKRLGSIMATY